MTLFRLCLWVKAQTQSDPMTMTRAQFITALVEGPLIVEAMDPIYAILEGFAAGASGDGGGGFGDLRSLPVSPPKRLEVVS